MESIVSIQSIESSKNVQSEDIPVEDIQSFDLNLSQVMWKPHFILSGASISQIITSFSNILRVNPKNQYEITLYRHLKPAIVKLVNAYNNILKCNTLKEQQVKYYNLIVSMPFGVSVYDEEHGVIMLRNAKIGALVKAAKQRLMFIQERDIPMIYTNDPEILREFNNMKSQIGNFNIILNQFEKDFVFAINEAHKMQSRFQ